MNEPQPAVGLATLEDVPELARLRWELYTEQEAIPAETIGAYRDRFERFARTAVGSEDWRAWVTRAHDRLVGAMWLQTVHRVPVPGKRAGPIGHLTNVYVAPEHRNSGLGGQMLDVTDWCRSKGYSVLIVWPTERSRPFYGRAGFARPDEPLVLDVTRDRPFDD